MKKILLLLVIVLTGSRIMAQNVGIGTTTPGTQLTVVTPAASFGIEHAAAGGVSIKTFLSGTYGQIGTFSNHPFDIMANNGLGQLRLMPNGFVGINTTNPGSQLTIKAVTNTPALELNDGVRKVQAYVNGNGANIGVDLGIFGLATAGVIRLIVDSIGNVGIGGFGASSAHLHVTRGSAAGAPNGTAQFDGTVNASHFNYSTNETTYIRGGKANSEVIVNDVSTGNVRLAEGGGMVGIGTGSPAYTLDVNGTLRSAQKAIFSGTVQISGGTPGINKVLTSSDGAGNAVWSLPAAYNTGFKLSSSSQLTNIGQGTNQVVLFDNLSSANGMFDDGSNFNNTTHVYVAPATGVYQFNATVSIASGVAAGAGYISIEPNGSGMAINLPHSSISVAAGAALPQNISISFITKMNTGDTIGIKLYNNVGSTSISTTGSSYFSGSRIY